MGQLTQIDPDIGSPTFAINLIADPTEPIREIMTTIRDAISRRIPEDAFFRCPAASLHLSVFQLVWARSEDARAGDRAWAMCCDQVVTTLGALTASTQGFLLRSPSIHAEESAVIAA